MSKMKVGNRVDQERLCLKWIDISQRDLEQTLHKELQKSREFLEENKEILAKKRKSDGKFILKMRKSVKSHQKKINQKIDNQSINLDKSMDIMEKMSKIRKFLNENEERYEENLKMLSMMEQDQKRIMAIRSMLHVNSPGFEKENPRISEIYTKMTRMIRKLPLSEDEHHEMDLEIEAIAQNHDLDGKGKVEMVALQLLALMSSWNQNTTGTMSNSDFQSIISIDSSDCTDDTNLNDIDGALRTARIKLALGEPTETCATAYSQDSFVTQKPARSITTPTPEPATGSMTTNSNSDASFITLSSISLSEMIGEALHTAKSIAETQATSVLKSLQKSVVHGGDDHQIHNIH